MAYKTEFKTIWKLAKHENAIVLYISFGICFVLYSVVDFMRLAFTESPEDKQRREYFDNMQRINDSLDIVIAKHKQKKQAKLDSINNIEKHKQDSIANYLFSNRDSLQKISATKSLTDYGLKIANLRCEVLGRKATSTKCQYVHNKKLYLTDCKIVSIGNVDCVPGLFNSSVKTDFQF